MPLFCEYFKLRHFGAHIHAIHDLEKFILSNLFPSAASAGASVTKNRSGLTVNTVGTVASKSPWLITSNVI